MRDRVLLAAFAVTVLSFSVVASAHACDIFWWLWR